VEGVACFPPTLSHTPSGRFASKGRLAFFGEARSSCLLFFVFNKKNWPLRYALRFLNKTDTREGGGLLFFNPKKKRYSHLGCQG